MKPTTIINKICVAENYVKYSRNEVGTTDIEEKFINYCVLLIDKSAEKAYKEYTELSDGYRFIKRITNCSLTLFNKNSKYLI